MNPTITKLIYLNVLVTFFVSATCNMANISIPTQPYVFGKAGSAQNTSLVISWFQNCLRNCSRHKKLYPWKLSFWIYKSPNWKGKIMSIHLHDIVFNMLIFQGVTMAFTNNLHPRLRVLVEEFHDKFARLWNIHRLLWCLISLQALLLFFKDWGPP